MTQQYILFNNHVIEFDQTVCDLIKSGGYGIRPDLYKVLDTEQLAQVNDVYDDETNKFYSFDIHSYRECIKSIVNGIMNHVFLPINVNNINWDADEKSVNNIQSTIISVNILGETLPEDFTWKSHDNEFIKVNIDDLIAIAKAINNRKSKFYKIAWDLKSQAFHSDIESDWMDEISRLQELLLQLNVEKW